MATVQSEFGRVTWFEEFGGGEDIIAETAASRRFGDFRVIGQGIAEADSGITVGETDPNLNGAGKILVTDEDNHSAGLTTAKCLDVALNGPIVMEARVQFSDLDTKSFYFGLTDVNDDTAILEGGNLTGATETITLTASDLCGFFLSSELTEDEMWHGVYNGGTTVGETVSTNLEFADAVLAEWDILRLEVDPNGTARWYLNGELKQTVVAAVSTTTDLAALCMVHNLNNTSTTEAVDVDYIAVRCNRDWTI